MKKGFWTYICDKCSTIIVESKENSYSTNAKSVDMQLKEMAAEGRYFLIRSRKGNRLHYCSKKCMDAHFHSGKGTPQQYGYIHYDF